MVMTYVKKMRMSRGCEMNCYPRFRYKSRLVGRWSRHFKVRVTNFMNLFGEQSCDIEKG